MKPMVTGCTTCATPLPGPDLLDHYRLFHPDHDPTENVLLRALTVLAVELDIRKRAHAVWRGHVRLVDLN